VEVAAALGVESAWKKASGAMVKKGEEVARFCGTPEQIVKLENLVIGLISKPSGIASAAHRAKKAAGGRVRLVCGGWKKHPFPIKEIVLEAVTSANLASGYADNLLLRAADVTIKERRPLLLVTRETPLSPVHLENMLKLSRWGVRIMPACPGFYHLPQTLNEVVDQFVFRMMDALGFASPIKRWGDFPSQ